MDREFYIDSKGDLIHPSESDDEEIHSSDDEQSDDEKGVTATFEDPEIASPTISIEYKFPLIWPVRETYVSQTGSFTASQIGKIIYQEYEKFYADRREALENGRIPRWLSENCIDRDNLCLRFWIGWSNKNRPPRLFHPDLHREVTCLGMTNIPDVQVGVDT